MEDNIQIEIKIKNRERLLANANIYLLTQGYGVISIKDFQIWKSSNNNERLKAYLNITPPSIKVGLKYSKRVFFEDQKQWWKLERLIYKEFLKKQSESEPVSPKDVDDYFRNK